MRVLGLKRKPAKQCEFYKKKSGGSPASSDIQATYINEIIRKPKKFMIMPSNVQSVEIL